MYGKPSLHKPLKLMNKGEGGTGNEARNRKMAVKKPAALYIARYPESNLYFVASIAINYIANSSTSSIFQSSIHRFINKEQKGEKKIIVKRK